MENEAAGRDLRITIVAEGKVSSQFKKCRNLRLIIMLEILLKIMLHVSYDLSISSQYLC